MKDRNGYTTLQMLIVIGSNRVVEFMIKNTYSKKRNTGLMYKLCE